MDLSAGDLLRKALSRVCAAPPAEVRHVPIEHWNESTFRWTLVRHLLAEAPGTVCWSEWHRVDLVLPAPGNATLIELKFFGHRPLRDHSGRVLRMKGGPSEKNVREFKASLDTLASSTTKRWASACGQISAGYLVLAYCDPAKAIAKTTYGSYYGKLRLGRRIAAVETIVDALPISDDTVFTCKLLTVRIARAA